MLISITVLSLGLVAGLTVTSQAAEAGMPFRTAKGSVVIPHDARLEPSYTGEFTVSLWYKPEAIMSNPLPRLWGKGANYIAVMGNYDNGTNSEHHRVALEISNGDSHTEFWARPTRLADGTWYHVMIAFDQDECLPKMLIDNVPQTVKVRYPWCDKTNRKMKTNSKPITIGNNNDLTRSAAGRIRDVAYYDRVLTADEQTKVFQGDYKQPNLVYHLPMCATECASVPDVSDNDYNGIPQYIKWQ